MIKFLISSSIDKLKTPYGVFFYINKKRAIALLCSIGWGTWIRTKEMSDSESDALPLGYTPMRLIIIL